MTDERRVRVEAMPKTRAKEKVTTESNYRYLPGDDWVQAMTQPQRDDILARAEFGKTREKK